MSAQPNPRIPLGILLLIGGLVAYALVIARYVPEWIGGWPVIVQTVVYLVLGLAWLLPLRRFLTWMEAGRPRD